MGNKRAILIILGLEIAPFTLLGAAGRPEDGFLFFIVLLGFLGVLLGIIHLVEYVRNRIRDFLDGIIDGMLP